MYISYDQEEEDFKSLQQIMPWAFLPFNDPKIKDIVAKFQITSIPKLIVLDKNLSSITEDGRKDVCIFGINAFSKWIKL